MIPNLNLLTVCLVIFQFVAFAQEHPFSDEVVTDSYGNEIMPYARGEVRRLQNVLCSDFPTRFLDSYSSTLDKIMDFATNWDKLQPPQGFRASFYNTFNVVYNGDAYKSLSEDPQPYNISRLEIIFEPYYKSETGKPAVAQIGISASGTLTINNPYLVVGSPVIADIYVCPRKTAEFYGFPIYQTNSDEITVVSKKQFPLFIPVTQEEYIKAHITFWEREIAKNRKEQQNPENEKSVREIVDGEKAGRQKAMEEAYRELLKFDKNAAEELKKTMLELETELAANFAKDQEAGYSKNDILENDNSMARQTLAALQAELAAFSPAQREKQAHYHADAQGIYQNRSGLVPFEEAKPRINCEPLVRINKKIVDANNPEPQLLVISWSILFSGAESHQSPRLFESDKERYRAHAGDKSIAEFYKQHEIWQNIFGLVVK